MEEATLLHQIQQARIINWMEEVFFSSWVTRLASIALNNIYRCCGSSYYEGASRRFSVFDFETAEIGKGKHQCMTPTNSVLPRSLKLIVDERCKK